MSTGVTEQPPAPPALSEAERAAAFRRTEPRVPHQFVLIVVASVAVLAVGGLLLEHVLSSVGLNPAATATATVPRATPSSVVAPPAVAPADPEVGAPLPAFMGITALGTAPAPAISLVDQDGHPVSLSGLRGDAVVLTFFDAPCQDICPVVASEIARASGELGPDAPHVVFLTVNTDPLALSPASAVTAVTRSGLGAVRTWHFLTAPLGTLDPVWQAYGVSINVSRTSGLVAHNDVMYFIDPAGRLRYRATPFADESATGAFSLPAPSIARWGQGIATYAGDLLRGTP